MEAVHPVLRAPSRIPPGSTQAAPAGPVAGEKIPGTALLLNFLLPGAGHLYGSGGKRGTAVLVVNLICGVITAALFAAAPPFAIPTFLVQLILWIQSMSYARAVTEGRLAPHGHRPRSTKLVR
jgi:hypothetical protein